jgi:hypothetical protein
LKQPNAGSKPGGSRQNSKKPESVSKKLASANESPNARIDGKRHHGRRHLSG